MSLAETDGSTDTGPSSHTLTVEKNNRKNGKRPKNATKTKKCWTNVSSFFSLSPNPIHPFTSEIETNTQQTNNNKHNNTYKQQRIIMTVASMAHVNNVTETISGKSSKNTKSSSLDDVQSNKSSDAPSTTTISRSNNHNHNSVIEDYDQTLFTTTTIPDHYYNDTTLCWWYHDFVHRRNLIMKTAFYQNHCVYMPSMLGWFFFSALLSSYNKYVFGDKFLDFPCPLLLTTMHFGTQWLFAHVVTDSFGGTSNNNNDDDDDDDPMGGDRVRNMSWNEFLWISVPCGLVTCGDVGLSNLSLVHISMTFYTMVKSSTPVFVLVWAWLFGIEQITWTLCGVVLIIAIGEFFTVVGEVEFELWPFLCCLAASVLSGARWTLVQLKIQSLDPPLKTTFATMRLLAPTMFWGMLFVALILEKPWISLTEFLNGSTTRVFYVLALGMIGATLAICMILCEFYLIMHASAVILMIGGVIKELITIVIGYVFFVVCCCLLLFVERRQGD